METVQCLFILYVHFSNHLRHNVSNGNYVLVTSTKTLVLEF